MRSLKNIFKTKALTLVITKGQKELLELLMINKPEFDQWSKKQGSSKIKFQFFYPAAIDFYYDEFKLFTAYYKKGPKGEPLCSEFKMSETNYDTISCTSWTPFEEVIIDFLTSLEENKKIALFEKRKTLMEYQSLCTKNADANSPEKAYAKASALSLLKPTQS
jgi:hypothetical protein